MRRWWAGLVVLAVGLLAAGCGAPPPSGPAAPAADWVPPWATPGEVQETYRRWLDAVGPRVAEAQTPLPCDPAVSPVTTSRLGLKKSQYRQCRADLDYVYNLDLLDQGGHLATSGTWTAPQTFAAGKLLDRGSLVVDVRAYGAACDGVTDDASALAAAMAAAAVAGGDVLLPAGARCATSQTLWLRSNVRLRCGGGGGLLGLAGLPSSGLVNNLGQTLAHAGIDGCTLDVGGQTGAPAVRLAGGQTGTVGATSTTTVLKLAGAGWQTDQWVGHLVRVSAAGGCSASGVGTVTTNDATSLTITPALGASPVGCAFALLGAVHDVTLSRTRFTGAKSAFLVEIQPNGSERVGYESDGAYDVRLIGNVFDGTSTSGTDNDDSGLHINCGDGWFLFTTEMGCLAIGNTFRNLGGQGVLNDGGLTLSQTTAVGIADEVLASQGPASVSDLSISSSSAALGDTGVANTLKPAISGRLLFVANLGYHGVTDAAILYGTRSTTAGGIFAVIGGELATVPTKQIDSGTAATSSLTTALTSTVAEGWSTDQWAGYQVVLRGAASCALGTDATRIYGRRVIVGNGASTISWGPPFASEVDNCLWEINFHGMLYFDSPVNVTIQNLDWDNGSTDYDYQATDQLVIRNPYTAVVAGNTFSQVHATAHAGVRLFVDGGAFETGVADASSTTTTVEVPGKTWATSAWVNKLVILKPRASCGLGNEEMRLVTANDADTLTVTPPFSVQADNCGWDILPAGDRTEFGRFTGGSLSAPADSTRAWVTDEWAGWMLSATNPGGASGCLLSPSPQYRSVTANSATALTLSSALTVSSGSVATGCAYSLLGPSAPHSVAIQGNTWFTHCPASQCPQDSYDCVAIDDQGAGRVAKTRIRGVTISGNAFGDAPTCRAVGGFTTAMGELDPAQIGVDATLWAGARIHRTGSDCTSQTARRGAICTQEGGATHAYVCAAARCAGASWVAL